MPRLRAVDAERRAASDAGPEFSEALARGLKIIAAFAPDRRQMTLSDIAEHVDLPRATVRRALFTLTRLGYAETNGRLFRLAPRILTLASTYLVSNGISTLLQPSCERLSAAASEACSVAVLDGEDVVMIAHAAPTRFADVSPGAGFRLPAFSSALGRVLLAGLADDALDAFLKTLKPLALTPHTVTDKRALRRLVLAARRAGFALADQEAELGFRSIAVPLRRYDGKPIAAMNIGARIERASAATMRATFLPLLLRAADELQPQLL
jgi:IclR family pca regulon transcriptional regulator